MQKRRNDWSRHDPRAIAVAALGILWQSAVSQEPAGATAELSRPPIFRYEGVATCAARACHGGAGTLGSKSAERTTWLKQDPHAKAFEALRTALSRTIVERLEWKAAPDQTKACLDCHAVNPTPAQRGERFDIEEGVGCEACHGSAQQWLAPHIEAAWKRKPVAEKLALGMRNTKSAYGRTQLCAECHVGSADKEVTHAMVAAGHPRLLFEAAAFHGNMPKHWNQEQEKRADPAQEVRLWLVGQLNSAAAAVTLASHRPGEESAAPEFAHYDCFACHQTLHQPSTRPRLRSGSYPGALVWGTWYVDPLTGFLGQLSNTEAGRVRAGLSAVSETMRIPLPDQARLQTQANTLSGTLRPWAYQLASTEFNADAIGGLLAMTARLDPKSASRGWPEAFQRYLALKALAQGQLDVAAAAGLPLPGPAAALKQKLSQLEPLLQFPRAYESPRDFDAAKVQAAFEAIQQLFRAD